MAVEWRANEPGLRELMVAPGAVRAMDLVGAVVKDEAERIAPVVTGAYAFGADSLPDVTGGGFHITADTDTGTARVRIYNTVRRGHFPYGTALELGTKYMRAQHILGRALDALHTI